MILRYVYADRNGSKQLVGCVCRTDEGRLGYSAVHPKDRRKLSRKMARRIALGRAEKCSIDSGQYNIDLPPDMFKVVGGWHKSRGNFFSKSVPPAVVPALAALAALGPKEESMKWEPLGGRLPKRRFTFVPHLCHSCDNWFWLTPMWRWWSWGGFSDRLVRYWKCQECVDASPSCLEHPW